MKILLVAIGSALGGVLRYLVPCLFAAHKGFPWATLTVNVVGSLLIGLLSGLLARHGGALLSVLSVLLRFRQSRILPPSARRFTGSSPLTLSWRDTHMAGSG